MHRHQREPWLPLMAVQVPRRNFEGLFQHALRPSGSFAQALR
ncbi:MAG: TIGR02265 family protein, partial [Myxococcaceae bacterium]